MNSWRIKIQRAAKEDLRSGYEFYNAQEFGLGNYFYDCLMSDIDALAYYGGVHRQYHGFYKALSSRFPYAIYYKLSEGFVKVYAVCWTLVGSLREMTRALTSLAMNKTGSAV